MHKIDKIDYTKHDNPEKMLKIINENLKKGETKLIKKEVEYLVDEILKPHSYVFPILQGCEQVYAQIIYNKIVFAKPLFDEIESCDTKRTFLILTMVHEICHLKRIIYSANGNL